MDLRSKAVDVLHKATKLKKTEVEALLTVPPRQDMGDLTFPCFILSKKLKKSSGEIALQLREKVTVPKGFQKVEVAGPYLNFYFSSGEAAREILVDAIKKNYGKGKRGKKISLEGFNANPYKSVHVGHFRGGTLGAFLQRAFTFNGDKVFFTYYSGDVGSHIAKWLWYYDKFYKGSIPKENICGWAGEMYVKAVEKAGENSTYEIQARDYNKRLEERDPSIVGNWKKIRDLCWDEIESIGADIGLHIDARVGESDTEEIGKKTVLSAHRKGLLEKDEGALLIDLEKHDLNKFLLLKSDGTTLYSTKDLGLMKLKQKAFKADKYIIVVGAEQTFHFRQLFKTFELLKIPGWNKIEVVHNGFVTAKTGKMSSRKGNVVTYKDMYTNLVQNARKEIKKRNPKMSEKELDSTAKKIAVGALIFGMVKYTNNKTVVFDSKEALRFDGDTGPYIQYGLVRAKKIMANSRTKVSTKVDFSLIDSRTEKALIKLLGDFVAKVTRAREERQPSIIANYALELVHAFNSFYEQNHVLNAPAKEKKARLLLVEAYRNVLSKCLYLLAIPEVEQM